MVDYTSRSVSYPCSNKERLNFQSRPSRHFPIATVPKRGSEKELVHGVRCK